MNQYTEAVWIEERQMNLAAAAIVKAFAGKN